jgi:hypothetical protein
MAKQTIIIPSTPQIARKQPNSTARSIPEFKVRPEEALELLMASNFLDT